MNEDIVDSCGTCRSSGNTDNWPCHSCSSNGYEMEEDERENYWKPTKLYKELMDLRAANIVGATESTRAVAQAIFAKVLKKYWGCGAKETIEKKSSEYADELIKSCSDVNKTIVSLIE